jgi:hypothetical protein
MMIFTDHTQLAIDFISQCKKTTTSLSSVDSMVFSCGVFVNSVVESLELKFKSFLKKRKIDDDDSNVQQLLSHFDQHKRPFTTVDTLYKRNAF